MVTRQCDRCKALLPDEYFEMSGAKVEDENTVITQEIFDLCGRCNDLVIEFLKGDLTV
jgi:hypothetical protein